MAAALESDSAPPFPATPGGGVRLSHAFSPNDFASPACVRAWPGAWRAGGAPLKPAKKVVTAHGTSTAEHELDAIRAELRPKTVTADAPARLSGAGLPQRQRQRRGRR